MTTDTSENMNFQPTIEQLIDDDEIPEINGCPEWAVVAFIDNIGVAHFDNLTDVESQLEDAFVGIYESEKAFGEEYADDVVIGGSVSSQFDTLATYFDYEKFTRDLFIDGYYSLEHPSRTDPVSWKQNYDIAVFRNL